MRVSTALAACAVTAACASARSRTPEGVDGHYSVRTQSQSFVLNGQLAVLNGDVSLALDRTWCQRLGPGRNGAITSFSCNPIDGLTSLNVSIDAERLEYGSRWSGTVTRQRMVRTCVATAIVSGKEVCTSYKNLSEEYQAGVSGKLIVTAAPKAP